jgi:hypothetical protein
MAALVKEGQVKPVKPGTYIDEVPNFAGSFLKTIGVALCRFGDG